VGLGGVIELLQDLLGIVKFDDLREGRVSGIAIGDPPEIAVTQMATSDIPDNEGTVRT
jgi:hypothetical protein